MRGRRAAQAAAVAGALLLAVSAESWVTPLAAPLQAVVARAILPEAPAYIEESDKPLEALALAAQAEHAWEGEDPNEDALIEAALVAQGYFRDDVPLSYELQDVLHAACGQYGIDYAVALGLIEVESGFDTDAVGPDGHDIGLFQIRTSNHAWLMEETGSDPMTPEGNIECGVWMLAYLLDQYDSLNAALTAYRYGHDTGDRQYASTVLAAAERWKGANP